MNDDVTVTVNPDTTRTTKTYSMTLGDITRVKDMAAFTGKSDAGILHEAIGVLYAQMFPGEKNA